VGSIGSLTQLYRLVLSIICIHASSWNVPYDTHLESLLCACSQNVACGLMPGIEAAIGLYEEAVATGFFKNVVEDDLSRSVAVILTCLSSGCVDSIPPVSFEGTTVCQVCQLLLQIVVGSVPAMPGVMKNILVPGAICILLVR